MASVAALGNPLTTSAANVGPERQPKFLSGNIFDNSFEIRLPVVCSNQFEHHITC